jgi:hypothetical protein
MYYQEKYFPINEDELEKELSSFATSETKKKK